MAKLTKAQHEYLSALSSGADMRRFAGTHYVRTRRILERAGLLKHNVSPGHGGPRWELTDLGRRATVSSPEGGDDDCPHGAGPGKCPVSGCANQ